MNLQDLPVDKIKKILMKNGVAFAAIFGSHAKGTATPKSDVDILIEYKPGETPGYFKFFDLEEEIQRILQKDVDLLTVNELNPYIKPEIMQTMQIFYDAR